MKKNEAQTMNSMLDDEDELTVKQIKDGLDTLEQLNPVFTPNLQWFQHNVELEKKRILKKQRKDLLLFITVAVCVLSVVIAVAYSQPVLVLYLYFQLVGIILLPLAFNKSRKKVNNE